MLQRRTEKRRVNKLRRDIDRLMVRESIEMVQIDYLPFSVRDTVSKEHAMTEVSQALNAQYGYGGAFSMFADPEDISPHWENLAGTGDKAAE
jgi:hypothetical protein